MLGRALVDGVLKGPLVVLPEGALLYVVRGELPALVRVVEAGLQAPLLLVLGDVQKELEHGYAVEGEAALEVVYEGVAFPSSLLGHDPFYPHYEDVLVVRAVEDTDPTPRRDALVVAPEEVVVGLLGARSLEGGHPAPLGVDPAEDVLDGAVFAACVHGLQHDQQPRSFSA